MGVLSLPTTTIVCSIEYEGEESNSDQVSNRNLWNDIHGRSRTLLLQSMSLSFSGAIFCVSSIFS